MKITNRLNLPYGLVKAVSPEPHIGSDGVSRKNANAFLAILVRSWASGVAGRNLGDDADSGDEAGNPHPVALGRP